MVGNKKLILSHEQDDDHLYELVEEDEISDFNEYESTTEKIRKLEFTPLETKIKVV